MNESFRRFAQLVSKAAGHAAAFILGLVVIVVWVFSGPLFDYSDTWQLVINTGTTIVTFLMVFVLQNTQNRDNQAVQLKLDELLRAVHDARESFIDLEELPDRAIEKVSEELHELRDEEAPAGAGASSI
ncbi:MAG: hypothetical protein CVT60_06880 [Actinobacteria bacterium HGW-Actinobacteria-10]|jgi:low affinity Fe/Cu permease|nr:MAG: hypothetical protein CVT60_06880 [Actinobacteria bacterium HGW-Actinobacteria-10]